MWSWPAYWRVGLAEVVERNVECSEEGVHIEHEGSVPFPSGSGGKPTLECGHLPLKFCTGNSHQAFKRGRGGCWPHGSRNLTSRIPSSAPHFFEPGIYSSVCYRSQLQPHGLAPTRFESEKETTRVPSWTPRLPQ